MKAIFFSDLHLNLWDHYSSRFDAQLKVLELLCSRSNRHECPLFFGGDMFHSPKEVRNSLLSVLFPFLKYLENTYPKARIYAISGNHDMSEDNFKHRKSPSYVRTLSVASPLISCIDHKKYEDPHVVVHAVPYLTHNTGLSEEVSQIALVEGKLNILLIHTDFKGQKDTDGTVVGRGENLDESIFSRFDMVMSGHIHKPGKVRDNIYSIGAPLQLRLSDRDGQFGYWVIKDKIPKFKPLGFTPKYRLYQNPSEITNDTDIWIKVENKELAQVSMEDTRLDFKSLLKGYMGSIGVKSRRKKAKLKSIIQKVW